MYAYGGRHMEREDSVHSLSSRGGSDLGSRYTVESGIYMTSFAAAVFVAALVTAGVLLLTLLVTLTVMLQSCQTKNAGVVEMYRSNDDYNYCKNFALNLELNRLNVDSLPSFCQNVAIKYIKEGQYRRELNITVFIVENYLSSRRPLGDGLDVVLVDIDDFLPSDYSNLFRPRFREHVDDFIEEAKHVKRVFFQQLCMKIKAGGWSLILLSRKPEKLRNATIEHLISTRCGGWSSLIMRLDDEMQMNSSEYFSKRRTTIQEEGFRITAVISCQMDALTGPYLGKRIFKLPNPIYYNTQHSIDSSNMLQ